MPHMSVVARSVPQADAVVSLFPIAPGVDIDIIMLVYPNTSDLASL